MAQIESGQGLALLAHPARRSRDTWVQWQVAPLNIVDSSLPDAVSDVIFLTDHINTASGTLYVAFYLATAFFPTTLSREE